uniref:Uncharacterized protein n=1 Tax=Leptocylindrus danicus TaxID=163516 RepID=A0A7S2JVJ5_9STRA|mmetsp:Transcript_11297/g.17137  ORF Transcript_11297/g.17137 Transcript_11297/m.17137 type:complete len:713 (+) Transcript_11297:98-2236(+)|eukprot:CAMPEP_0116009754 /NCGR_PEP_ID=MMETSP0321-20121206/3611_1 /TAXON_ID=163516 /ORGANISM="Leptocylindrus danicus var. danicus, Strain B650" /LENGTH=712 /DNA_ID=CAMNT_0003478757 /DNA_START=42 /DNA_END=2180 /DNA_ORIENTATION=+
MSKRPHCSDSALLDAYNNVVSSQNEKLANEILIEQQSALQSLRDAGAAKTEEQSKIHDTLPSSVDDDAKLPAQDVYTMKCWLSRGGGVKRRLSKLYLEGGAMKAPRHSATIFMRGNYAAEDEKAFRYIPYFGDDDKDETAAQLFDKDLRERIQEFGTAYQENQKKGTIDNILRLLLKRGKISLAQQSLHIDIKEELAELLDISDNTIEKRYHILINDTGYSDLSEAENHGDVTSRWRSPQKLSSTKKGKKMPNNSSSPYELPYADLCDSFRSLFCRRCFSYDCNMHGNLEKPDVDVMADLALAKEQEGGWHVRSDGDSKKNQSNLNTVESKENRSFNNLNEKELTEGSLKNDADELCNDLQSKTGVTTTDEPLSPLTRSICARAYTIFKGGTQKMGHVLDADIPTVARFCENRGFQEKNVMLCHEIVDSSKKRKKGNKGNAFHKSMRHYNPAWLKRVTEAEIFPLFTPCIHEGQCNEKNCSCVENAFFCTKHCIWGSKSRNFYRGCACESKCTTNSCSCYAAKRECDPDLCKHCGACCDEPNKPATKQRCRNDNLSMRRHQRLLIAESSIKDAGWGLFTKYALKKGDFIQEYVGEVISQEEADRRGLIYDKVNRSYLFNMTSDTVVDASRKGNKTKFANHSSDKPNCFTRMVTVNGDARVGLFAKEDIAPESELFFDYRYEVGIESENFLKPATNVSWMKKSKMKSTSKKNV